MTLGKRFLAVTLGLSLVFVGMIGLIWFATRDDAPGPVAASDAPPAPAVDPPPMVSVPGLGMVAPLGRVPSPDYVIVKDEPAPPPPPGSWEAVPILQPRRGAINLDLEEVQPRLTECFSRSTAALSGSVLETKDAAPLRDDAATTLLLELEVTGDRVYIVDAPVESRGQATSGTLACAQAALRGRTAPSPGLSPGKHRLRYTLAP